MDEPWIMTVKGPHSIKPPPPEEVTLTPTHKTIHKVQNGSGPTLAKSPPKDANLNHYRLDKAAPVSNNKHSGIYGQLKSILNLSHDHYHRCLFLPPGITAKNGTENGTENETESETENAIERNAFMEC